jgi:HSP20 family molecular chaperone IbpA
MSDKNSELTVIGRREHPQEGKPILRERVSGDYLMTSTLDETVDASKVDAVLERGLLTLTPSYRLFPLPSPGRCWPGGAPGF